MPNTHHTELMDHESRAGIYWWFSTLLTRELTPEELRSYFHGEGASLLQMLVEEPLFSEEVQAMQGALAKLLPLGQPDLELAADFSQIFLNDRKTGAPPYASVYLSETGELYEQSHIDMMDLFKEQGLVIDPKFKEPADHIAILLDYLGNLIIQDAEKPSVAQSSFIEKVLLAWLPDFVAASQKVNNSGFYQALCRLLLKFVQSDRQALN